MRAVITGAGSGIGRAVARMLAERTTEANPARLLLVDRDRDAVQLVAAELSVFGVHPVTCVVNLADRDAGVDVMQHAHTRLGGLDALISNAGAIHAMPIEDVGADEFDRMFAINARATLLLAQAAFPMLKESRGSIVATASTAAEHPAPALGVYSASKAALAMLVEQMALEWGPLGIRCNCISPGPTHTGMTAASYDDPARREQRGLDIPLRRVGRPEDLASAILFLISPAASFITGVNLMVDGGLTRTLMVSPNSAALKIT
ncbi:MAG: SDR family NAD(P)-dependent oxidoreductase [Janthinobacterium lividum]